MNIKPIETQYKGYRFRSRLEARWAVFFDALGIDWDYEPEGFILDNGEMYLPDFYIKDWDCYAEVKPYVFSPDEYRKANSLDRPCLLLDSSFPDAHRAYFITGMEWGGGYTSKDFYGWVLLDYSKHKGRLWFLFGESAEDYIIDDDPEIAAKSARFEFGENGGSR